MTERTLTPSTMPVPFVDLRRIHDGLKGDLLAEISDLIDAGAFTNGPQVEEFERGFAAYCRTTDCVGLASGLDALRLVLIALGLRPGDEVIVPAMTFVATFEAVTQAGGIPVPVDVLDGEYTLDPSAADAAATPATRFLVPVHLYGQMADMRALQRLAVHHGLAIVEDACQAHGAERDGLRAGAAGAAGAFSFYPAKNLGAFGDAGALTTNDAPVAAALRALREHGQRRKYEHDAAGYTARLDTIQALVLLRKLTLLDRWNEDRQRIAAAYSHGLAEVGDLRLPTVPDGSSPVWHLYVVRTADPTALAEFLSRRGISTARHYPQPPPLSPAYASLGLSFGAFPVAEAVASEALSLPIFPGISDGEVEAVIEAASDFFGRG
jgi:dTDP-3-amino-3,4,6-trideoxy-alpha-D-glucose transaminase